MNKDKNNLVEFRAIVESSRFVSEEFKIYVVSVNKEIYPHIKPNKNNEYIIVGNIPSLMVGTEYQIKASIEINKNFGLQYKISSIKQDKPTNIASARKFLIEIITENQTDVLLSVYPNIIDKIIKNDLDDIDLNKTKGIKEATFKNIKSKIIENFCLIDLVEKFGGYIEMSVIKKLYDKYTSPKIVEKQLKLDPYKCLCKLSRIGFKTADGILLNLEEYGKQEGNEEFFDYDLKTSSQRMKSCLNYILEENENNGHTNMTIENARKECGKLVPQCITLFVKVIKDNEDINIDNKTKTISTKTAYETELYIAKTLKQMLKNKILWKMPIELYREVDGYSMTDEQMETLTMMCKNNIGILTAPAGSGKSASVQSFINMLEDNEKTYLLTTPTGASAEVLADFTGREAGTIHRQLKFNPSAEIPWTYNENNKLDYDVVVIDEFSMVDIYLFKHLLEAIDLEKTKLLLVFDSFQLASVGCGNLAQDLLSSGRIPTTILTKIFRYNEGGLMQVVTHIRKSEEFLPNDFKGVKIFGEKKDFIYSDINQIQTIPQIIKIYSKLLNDGYGIQDIMVLSSQNKGDYGTVIINKAIQSMFQKKKKTKFVMRGDTKFHEGDKVLQVSNNYKAKDIYGQEVEIFNGNLGIVSQVGYNEIVVSFKGDKKILYTKEDLEQLELGYCISTHKSQGSGCKQIIMVAPKSHTFMLNSNLLYVGGTRAKQRVFLLGNIITINRAIKKKENLQRNTYTKHMLLDETV
ncbi:AAA family ATPase [Clostridium sp.]|uniref:AAA family ATPase n=1 Tax=Clostridium sp. TaxID=1506 RepID=UPI002603B537|nr:AAA family ATPase [Clostridium sp.]